MTYEIEKIQDYIQVFHPEIMKNLLLASFIVVNMLGLFTAFQGSLPINIKMIIISMIILINVWGFVIFLNLEKYQKSFILFYGVSSFCISIIFLILAGKIYCELPNHDVWQFVAWSVGIYILILISCFAFHINALKKGYYAKKNKKKQNSWASVAGLATFLGVIFARLVLNYVESNELQTIITMMFPIFLAYAFAFCTTQIHKYFLIKEYEQYVYIYILDEKKQINK